MERNVTVNALPENDHDDGLAIDILVNPPSAGVGNADLGPCLYLGPEGQRCDQRAFDRGYCAKHQPGAKPPISSGSKVVAASIGIIGLIWPYLADLFREMIRLLHPH